MRIAGGRLALGLLVMCALAVSGCVLEERALVESDAGSDAASDASDGAMDGSMDGGACPEPCQAPRSICDESGQVPRCVECIQGEGDCQGLDRPFCDMSLGSCVECLDEEDTCVAPQRCELGVCVP